MRINVGIRRRLAPLLDNGRDEIELVHAILFSLPGSPVLYYGDEIGMGDNVYLGDRDGVRTPMQWRPDRNAGFSSADPQRLYLPPIMDPVYGYLAVNVEAQVRETSSLLNWMRRMLAARKLHKAFGRGTLTFLKPANRKILAYLREYEDDLLLCVVNLARSAQPVELDLSQHKGLIPTEVMGRATFPSIGDAPYVLTLPGHGFMWFRLAKGDDDITSMAEYSAYILYKARGADVEFVAPPEGLVATPLIIGAVSKAPHPEASKLFVDWAMSNHGQKFYQDHPNLYYGSVRDNPPAMPTGEKLSAYKLIFPTDWDDYGKQREVFNKEWNAMFGL